MINHELQLRTSRHFRELAEEIAHLVWKEVISHPPCPKTDPHRFPHLSLAINAVLLKHIGECQFCADPESCDPWARTGGGAPTYAERPPICAEHEKRLRHEVGAELDRLFLEIEMEIGGFLTRYGKRAMPSGLAERIHFVIQSKVAPLLINNIASSCCDECLRSAPSKLNHVTEP